jgi:DNA polymerase III alpha subunit (gram-positive type)
MIIWDTETTGLLKPEALGAAAQPRIIDFAGIKIDNETGEEIVRLEFLVHPGCPITDEITKITGYKDSDFIGKPSFSAMLPMLAEFFLGERAMLAHNLPFDKGMLHWELVRLDQLTSFPWPVQQLCTVQLFMAEYGRRMKLTELYADKLGRKLDQKHTAMADAEALLEIVRSERLWEIVSTVNDPAPKKAPARKRAAK